MVLIPKLFSTLKNYDRRQCAMDIAAGVVVGVVAIPLALAFAIASGVSPEKGLYTAIVAGFLISALGGSRVQIGGPTGAFVVIVYGIVTHYGLDGLTMCTIMAGCILIVMGFARMGSVIKFIPYPVITGFTSGIAVIIFSSQVKDFFGLKMGSVPAEFIAKWGSYFSSIGTLSPDALALSLFALLILLLLPKITHKVPAPIVALLAATMAAYWLKLPIETIGSRFGQLPQGLPSFSWPHWSWNRVPDLIRPATTVALLAGIESLLSAVVADGMIGGRHRASMELIAQGVANIASPLFGGIPATGAIARTATNIKSGGRTPIAGITHALVLTLVLVFLGKWVTLIPLCALASILVIVAYHMSEWRSFASILKSSRSDVVVLLTTFFLTVLVDLTVAVEVGMVLAAFLFMRRMAELTHVDSITRELKENGETNPEHDIDPSQGIPKGIEVYEINGPFFFGAASKLGESLAYIEKPPKVFILRMRHVPTMDATGLHALEDFYSRCKRQGTTLILSEIHHNPFALLKKADKIETFGKKNLKPNFQDALKYAKEILAG